MSRQLIIEKSKNSPPYQGGARGGLTIIAVLFLLLSTSFLLASPIPGGDDDTGGTGQTGGTGGTGDGPGVGPGDDDPPASPVTVALANPSFDESNNNEELPGPNNWTPLTLFVGDNYIWDSEVKSAGSHSISIHSSRWNYGRWTSDELQVEGDGFQWYTLMGNVRAIGNNGEVYLAIAWFNTDGDMINTSDSPMLQTTDTDWISMSVNAMPPTGAAQLEVWCISNHNTGQTWFDALELTRTSFTTDNTVSYSQFLIDYPTHLLAIEANVMQVQELATKAKWTKEADFYNSDVQLNASRIYAEAAGITRKDTVFANVFSALFDDAKERAEALAAAKARFDGLIDESLWHAVRTSEAGGDSEKAKEYLSILEDRGADVGPVGTTGGNDGNGDTSPPTPE